MQNVFKHFISRDILDDKKRIAYLIWFVDQFPLSEFHGDDYYMVSYMRFSAALEVPLKSKYLDVFINTELRALMVKSNVKVAGTEQFNYEEPVALESAFYVLSDVLHQGLDILRGEESDIEDFKVDIIQFAREKLSDRYIQVLTTNFEKARQAQNVPKAVEDSITDLMMIQTIYDENEIKEALEVTDGDTEHSMEFVVDFGIPGVDTIMCGLKTSQLMAIAGPTGFGKTRLSTGVILYRAVTKYKVDCVYYVLEQAKEEIENILISVHCFNLFGVVISDGMISSKSVPEEAKDRIEAARIDLFESGKYGKCKLIETELYSDTFIHKIKVNDNLFGPFGLVFIDYMSLIDQPEKYENRNQVDWRATKAAYRTFKRYVRMKKKAGIAVDQLNSTGDSVAREDKDILPQHFQNGMEALKSCDYGYVLTATTVMRAQSKLTLQNPKARGTAQIPRVLLQTRMDICQFKQDVKNKL